MAVKFKNTTVLRKFGLWMSILLVSFCDYLALVPYLLRSLRIQQMFLAREKYVQEERIPRDQIQKWGEIRMLWILFASIVVYTVLTVAYIYNFPDHSFLIASFWIGGLFGEGGTFRSEADVRDLYSTACSHFVMFSGL